VVTPGQAEQADENRVRRLRLPVPAWNRLEPVAKRVEDEVEELKSEIDRLAWTTETGLPDADAGEELHLAHALVIAESYRGWVLTEQAAVAATLRGDVDSLANLLRSVHYGMGLPDEVNPAIARFAPETWTLIADLLTGKLKRKRGPRRQSEEVRRTRNPVHDAADHVPLVSAVLSRLYPTKSKAEIKKRTIEVASLLGRVARPHVLQKHLYRKIGDRHRVR
jgi:hypothetical protein